MWVTRRKFLIYQPWKSFSSMFYILMDKFFLSYPTVPILGNLSVSDCMVAFENEGDIQPLMLYWWWRLLEFFPKFKYTSLLNYSSIREQIDNCIVKTLICSPHRYLEQSLNIELNDVQSDSIYSHKPSLAILAGLLLKTAQKAVWGILGRSSGNTKHI